jgi:hypothetical protein
MVLAPKRLIHTSPITKSTILQLSLSQTNEQRPVNSSLIRALPRSIERRNDSVVVIA